MRKYVATVFQSWTVFTVGLFLGYASFVISNIIYTEQPDDFIDEIFHVPQAKQYCQNQWNKWDPKITTPPGLYLVSYCILKPLHLLGVENFCTVYALRLTNVLATTLNFFITYVIVCALERKYAKFKSKFYFKLLTALNVALFPPLYFFTFLYYTDVWSTTFVLLMYSFHLADGKWCKIMGGFAGFMAVFMRQTNIIWVGLMFLDDVWGILGKNVKGAGVQDYKHAKEVCQRFFSTYFTFKKWKNLKKLIDLAKQIIAKCYPNVTICLLFVAFVIVNGSVVLGDKQAHAVTFHPMQVLYFLHFATFFGWPFFILEVPSLWKNPVNVFISTVFLGLFAGLSEVNKLEHPYLLADNRHLAFYFWRKIFGHALFRRLLVPAYVCSGILLIRLLRKRCLFLFTVLLSVCTVLNLTPQYLFELRYFIIPFTFFRLQFRQSVAVAVETTFYVAVNFGVIYLFLNRPFVWPNEPNLVQRFIW